MKQDGSISAVPILEPAARRPPRPEAHRNRARRHQVAARRHLHPGKRHARRSRLPARRHAALRHLWPRTQGLLLPVPVAREGPAHGRAGWRTACSTDKSVVVDRLRGHQPQTAAPSASNCCCCRSTAAWKTSARSASSRPSKSPSGWAPTRSPTPRSNSVRVVDPDREPMFLNNRPADRRARRSRQTSLPASPDAVLQRGARRIRHLVVLPGGREEWRLIRPSNRRPDLPVVNLLRAILTRSASAFAQRRFERSSSSDEVSGDRPSRRRRRKGATSSASA